ncbi:MAG TPA: hypothetical protein VMT47_09335 [Polyangia bacterium]|nr:hypothetical protein [Polyangia bacterium]
MLHGLLGAWLALALAPTATPSPAASKMPAGTAAPATTVIPFRTDAQPRVDAVFGDAAALRLSVDRFLGLQTDMERVRDEFSTAVHETLTALAGNSAAETAAAKAAPKTCPAATAAPYARALASGTRYLLLGQQLQGRYRDIRRADELGDAAALTPDYRVKIKKARELHQRLLDDYREMRVAFYDQLGAEMRHASCKTGPKAAATEAVAAGGAPPPNPSDPTAWAIEGAPVAAEAHGPSPPTERAPLARLPPEEPPRTGMGAPAIWIDVDNTLCPQSTRVSVDGQSLGEVGPRKKTSVRTHAGPREICALPVSDARSCGDPGTIRKAYLHEGWSLTVHCDK